MNEIAKLKRGKRLVRKELEKEGKYPVFQNSLTPLGYYNKKTMMVEKLVLLVQAQQEKFFIRKKIFGLLMTYL